MKMLGFHFSDKPSVRKHVDVVKKRFRARYWILVHLRKAGFNTEELVRVYKTILRPVHDYLAVVFHSMMTDQMDEEVERLQAHALKYIFGWKYPYARLREMADIPTIRARRTELCDKFAQKCLGSSRFSGWFPLKGGVRASTRIAGEKYKETFARCERLRSSPLYFMRRRLNGKPGKLFGERNRQYRD